MNTIVLLAAGLALLILGGEVLVRHASRLAGTLGIPPLVIGLTVVAFGTGAPELAVSIQSVYRGNPGLVVGNIIGSNIANILLVLGLSAVVAPLVVSGRIIRRDIPLMLGASLLMWILALDRHFGRADGIVLFALFLVHLYYLLRQSRIDPSGSLAAAPGRSSLSEGKVSASRRTMARDLLFLLAGLALLIFGARWLVGGAVALASSLGMSDLIIGLTVVAVGTSLPEIVTSLIAGLRGERDIAVGNVVGSNLFNILSVLGLTAAVAPQGVEVTAAAVHLDMPVMIAVAFACLPIFLSEEQISRGEGGLFLGYYIAYTAYLIMQATEHDGLAFYSRTMLWFVLPLTLMTLLILLRRGLRQARSE